MKNFDILKKLYLEKEKKIGNEAYKYVLQLLNETQGKRETYLEQHDPDKDKGQSSRASSGKNFEKLIQHIITEPIESLGLKVVNGNMLERTMTKNLSEELRQVKRNLLIDYGEFGCHLPDVDIVIYNPQNRKVIAIISSKLSLRERITQTGYWKLKLLTDEDTAHIKVYLITPDKDGDLLEKNTEKKGRAIVEMELDGTYILTEKNLDDSDNLKLFEHFIEDFKKVIEESQ